MKQHKFSIRNRIWIDGVNGTFLGNGHIQLLEKISKTGSISQAAKELTMSYKKAWRLAQNINNHSSIPYIIKSAGGKKGGGSIITPAGLKAIKNFKQLNEKCGDFLQQELSNLSF